ncbi:ABC transporter permease [Paenibacillus gansuensis]|uniref:ABC transporter permease n=1 Tax=Paenibacillus gansuensis TaxID=306542 RepID=A0ABW5PF60_9BACL
MMQVNQQRLSAQPVKKPNKTLAGYMRRHWGLYLFLVPGMAMLLLNNYLPMFGIVLAFKNYTFSDGIFGSKWVGFDNFKYLFLTDDAWLMTRNTILYNLVFILLHLLIAVTFAMLLNELRIRFFAKVYQTVMFLPYFLSWVIVSYIGYAFLNAQYGFVNTTILPLLSLDAVDWYAEASYWPFILPLVSVWKDIGYATVIYLAAIVGFDKEYYEAAVIDGATKRQQAVYITLPLLRPVITIILLLQVGKIFYADFGLFYQVTLNSGLLYEKTVVIDTYVYTALKTLGDVGMASATGLYQSVIGFVLVVLTNLIVRKIDRDSSLF